MEETVLRGTSRCVFFARRYSGSQIKTSTSKMVGVCRTWGTDERCRHSFHGET
jgi:hypothetical protein